MDVTLKSRIFVIQTLLVVVIKCFMRIWKGKAIFMGLSDERSTIIMNFDNNN